MEKNNRLVYESPVLYIYIDNYKSISFSYKGWIFSDEYDSKAPFYPEYRIKMESKFISSLDELHELALYGRELAGLVSNLLPLVTYNSYYNPEGFDCCRTQITIDYKKPFKGWKSNFEKIYDFIERKGGSPYVVKINLHSVVNWTRIDNNPLSDLQKLIKNYGHLSEDMRYLLFLLNAAMESPDSNRYMILGKALEIINSIYPLEKNKSDDRLEIIDYKLKEVFNGITIKELIGWSNSKQEGRHYVLDKKKRIAHPQMTNQEKEIYYICCINLIVCIIRKSLGLEYDPLGFPEKVNDD